MGAARVGARRGADREHSGRARLGVPVRRLPRGRNGPTGNTRTDRGAFARSCEFDATVPAGLGTAYQASAVPAYRSKYMLNS
jgi:hypothetical protein